MRGFRWKCNLLISTTICLLQYAAATRREDIDLKSGENVHLICNSKTNEFPSWHYPGMENNSSRLQITNDIISVNGKTERISNLTIQNLDINDSGEYRCFLPATINEKASSQRSNEWGLDSEKNRDVIKKFNLFVYDDKNLLTEVGAQGLNVRIGEDAVIPCRGTIKNMSVRLTRPYGVPDYNRITHDRTAGYIIRNVSKSDEGSWSCIAHHGKQTSSRWVYILVDDSVRQTVAPTKVIKIPEIGNIGIKAIPDIVLVGEAVTIRCEVECPANIRPTIAWSSSLSEDEMKKFKRINGVWKIDSKNQQKPFITSKKGIIVWSEIKKKRIQMHDAATFQCSASLRKPPQNDSTKIEVIESPYIHIHSLPSFESINNSTNVTRAVTGFPKILKFKVDAFPPPDIQALLNGKPLGKRWFDEHFSKEDCAKSVIFTLKFNTTRHKDAGQYKILITISNHNIEKNISFTLDVVEPAMPVIIDQSLWTEAPVVITKGEALKLECPVIGNPQPKIQWYKGYKLADTKNGTFLKLRASDEDNGNYTCVATNALGNVSISTLVLVQDVHQKFKLGLSIGIPILVCLVAVIGYSWVMKNRKLRKIEKQMKIHMQYLAPILDIAEEDTEIGQHSYDSKVWEIPRDRLRLGKTIGRGAFGRVVQATAFDIDQTSSSCKTVAVKMLKAGCRTSEYQALMSELKILIHIGPHLNIVNLYGACTTRDGPLMIVVEYCRYGNMSNYLKKFRSNYLGRVSKRSKSEETDAEVQESKRSITDDGEITDVASVSGESAFVDYGEESRGQCKWNNGKKRRSATSSLSSTSNSVASRDEEEPLYRVKPRLSCSCSVTSKESIRNARRKGFDEEKALDEKVSLCETDLMSYGCQVARGMEFLASRKCIHRDLAARNILVADYQVVKICDFGLARDVCRDPDYVRTGEARLPLKWMALESIFDKVYSTKSDVWSFGVLLWEMFSLGASPYPGSTMDEEFFNKLKRGVRMKKPEEAPDGVYDFMLACWAENPNERPTFTKLAEEFSDILQSECENEYLDMLRIFQQNVESANQRKVISVQKPTETFEELRSCANDTLVEYTDVDAKCNIVIRKMRKATPLTADRNENLHGISSISIDDSESIHRSGSPIASSSQRPSVDGGMSISASESPPSYNTLMAE